MVVSDIVKYDSKRHRDTDVEHRGRDRGPLPDWPSSRPLCWAGPWVGVQSGSGSDSGSSFGTAPYITVQGGIGAPSKMRVKKTKGRAGPDTPGWPGSPSSIVQLDPARLMEGGPPLHTALWVCSQANKTSLKTGAARGAFAQTAVGDIAAVECWGGSTMAICSRGPGGDAIKMLSQCTTLAKTK